MDTWICPDAISSQKRTEIVYGDEIHNHVLWFSVWTECLQGYTYGCMVCLSIRHAVCSLLYCSVPLVKQLEVPLGWSPSSHQIIDFLLLLRRIVPPVLPLTSSHFCMRHSVRAVRSNSCKSHTHTDWLPWKMFTGSRVWGRHDNRFATQNQNPSSPSVCT